ncbi:MAG: sodium-dependent transporter, partial [Oscillospiraceae bacterium]
MLGRPLAQMGLWMAVTVVSGVLICSVGVRKGLERMSKVMMSALFVLILILAIHSFTLSGAKEGIRFYLVPNLETVKSVGLDQVIAAAM